jgi:hypothetical protein
MGAIMSDWMMANNAVDPRCRTDRADVAAGDWLACPPLWAVSRKKPMHGVHMDSGPEVLGRKCWGRGGCGRPSSARSTKERDAAFSVKNRQRHDMDTGRQEQQAGTDGRPAQA